MQLCIIEIEFTKIYWKKYYQIWDMKSSTILIWNITIKISALLNFLILSHRMGDNKKNIINYQSQNWIKSEPQNSIFKQFRLQNIT